MITYVKFPLLLESIRISIVLIYITTLCGIIGQRAPNPLGHQRPERLFPHLIFYSFNTTPFSVRDRLDAIQKGQTPRFSYKIAEDQPTDSEGGEVIPWSRESSDFILRQVAPDARWHAFLFHGNYYWTEILSQYFLPPGQPQDNFPADDEEVL